MQEDSIRIRRLEEELAHMERELLESKAQVRLLTRLLDERDGERRRTKPKRGEQGLRGDLSDDDLGKGTRLSRSTTLPIPGGRVRSSSLPPSLKIDKEDPLSRAPAGPSRRDKASDESDADTDQITPPRKNRGHTHRRSNPSQDRRGDDSPISHRPRDARRRKKSSPLTDDDFSGGDIPDLPPKGMGGLPMFPPGMQGDGDLPAFPPNFNPNGDGASPFGPGRRRASAICKLPRCDRPVKHAGASYCDNQHRG
jgi:hypothetical protein